MTDNKYNRTGLIISFEMSLYHLLIITTFIRLWKYFTLAVNAFQIFKLIIFLETGKKSLILIAKLTIYFKFYI